MNSDFIICLCGAAPGYHHRPDCPYPLYLASESDEARWNAERAERRREQDTRETTEQELHGG